MNKYQRFAVNHYLSGYMGDMTFDDILAAASSEDHDVLTISEAYEHLSLEEIADDIYQMAYDLESML